MNPYTAQRRRWFGILALSFGLTLWASASTGWAQARNLPDFTDLVEQVGPSVVNIRTTEKVQRSAEAEAQGPDDEMQELLRRFFGIPMPGGP
ncbi:MAG: hypothetical protein RIT26_1432, partial [Pseudomonadota bacterium]